MPAFAKLGLFSDTSSIKQSNSPFKGLLNREALRKSGLFAVWTPDDLVEKTGLIAENGSFGFQPLLGGLSPDEGWKSLELLKKTMPRLTALQD